jgi:hypothetical protein
VAASEDYPWSSLRATLGLAHAPAWLTLEALLARFGSRERYREFVHEGVGAGSPWTELRGTVLGSEGFVERMGSRLDEKATQREIPRRERLVRRAGLDAMFPLPVIDNRVLRNERIREVARAGAYTAAEIGRHLGLHYSTVSRIVTMSRCET